MVTNLAYFYETSQKIRGGKWVWVKDSNGEERKNVLLGGTILNPKKGFDHLYAAQLALTICMQHSLCSTPLLLVCLSSVRSV